MSFTFHIFNHSKLIDSNEGVETTMSKKKILVIEDEFDIAQLLKIHLSELCDQVQLVHDGEQGLNLALNQTWSAIILD